MAMLELAVLGVLHEAPMHGYELRKRLHSRIGAFRTFSYGTLYPTLRRMLRSGLIAEEPAEDAARGWGRKARRVYKITAEGKERFAELVGDSGPEAFDDDCFGVHLAFFARTPVHARMRILEGRRRRVEERRDGLRATIARASEQLDRYTLELHQMGLDNSDREVRWLNELIAREASNMRNNSDEQQGGPGNGG